MKIIVTNLICLMSIVGYGQTIYNKLYGYGTQLETVEGLLEMNDGYIMLLRTSSSSLVNRRLIVHKLDFAGNSIWSKVHFADSTAFYPTRSNDLEPTDDGGFIVAGVIWYGIEDDHDAALIKFDADGNIEWQKEYGGIGTDAAISFQQTSDKGFVLGGVSYSIDPEGDFYLVKTDEEGEMEWETHLGGTGYQSGYSVDYTADGGYIISGRAGNPPFAVDIAVAKCDSLGNPLWSKIYGGPYDNDSPHKVKALSDGNIMISGGMGNGEANYSTKLDGFLIKLDQDGEVIWESIYDEPYTFAHTSNMLEVEDGSIVVTGIRYNDYNGDIQATLSKYDSDGELIWRQIYPSPNPEVDSYLYGLTPASDGGFLAYGSAYDPEWTNFQEGWLIKTDSEGHTCEEVNCVVVDVEEVPQEEKVSLKVFPNPSTGWLNIRWKGDKSAQFGIYNLDGRLVWSGQNNEHNKSVNLSEHSPGMYFVRAVSDGKTVQQKVILSR